MACDTASAAQSRAETSFRPDPGRVGLGTLDGRPNLERHGCARGDGNIAVGALVETAIELRNVQILFPGGNGNGRDAVADVVDEAATALHERIDAEEQGKTGHWDVRHRRQGAGQHDET